MPALETAHPSLDALSEMRVRDEISRATNPAVAAHVAVCDTCQQSLVFLAQLDAQVASLPTPTPSEMLRASIVRDTAATIEPSAATPRRRWWVPAGAAAAALLAVAVMSISHGTPEAVAGPTAGTLTLSNMTPRAGERIAVQYVPGATLGRFTTLTLRARIRTKDADSYTTGTPVVSIGTLARSATGVYRGDFALPDSIVYAALAVEDSAAREIDDRDGRTWEVLQSRDGTAPTLAALKQRANDHFGRSWEVIFATARQMVESYPDSISAWSFLHASHGWMGLGRDSITALHRDRVRAFDRTLQTGASPSPERMGEMYWYARWVDSSVAARWEARLRREAPTNTFIVQNRMIDALVSLHAQHDTAAALRSLESIWRDAPVDRREQLLNYATSIAVASRDTAMLRRWTDRLLTAALTPSARIARGPATRSVALDFAKVPALRAEGLQRLRDELTRVRTTLPAIRALDETQEEYLRRQQTGIRNTLAALGKALSMDGQHRAALDTLQLAARTGRDLDVLRALRTEALAAADTAAALDATARLVVDPRTPASRRTEYTSFAVTQLGATRWQSALDAARKQFVTEAFATMRPRSIASSVAVVDTTGAPRDLRAALAGKITVVAFLSRFCGPAIEVLPELQKVASDLSANGVQTIAVFEETTMSRDLTSFIQKQKLSLPVLLDHTQAAGTTFNNWGTPQFYVIDARGRIMAEASSDPDELRVTVEAVRLAATMQ